MEASSSWSITRLASFKNSSRLTEEEDGPPLSTFELAPPPTSRSVITVSAPISPPFVVDSPSSPMETLGLPSAGGKTAFSAGTERPVSSSSPSRTARLLASRPWPSFFHRPFTIPSVSPSTRASPSPSPSPAGSEEDEALVCEKLEREFLEREFFLGSMSQALQQTEICNLGKQTYFNKTVQNN